METCSEKDHKFKRFILSPIIVMCSFILSAMTITGASSIPYSMIWRSSACNVYITNMLPIWCPVIKLFGNVYMSDQLYKSDISPDELTYLVYHEQLSSITRRYVKFKYMLWSVTGIYNTEEFELDVQLCTLFGSLYMASMRQIKTYYDSNFGNDNIYSKKISYRLHLLNYCKCCKCC